MGEKMVGKQNEKGASKSLEGHKKGARIRLTVFVVCAVVAVLVLVAGAVGITRAFWDRQPEYVAVDTGEEVEAKRAAIDGVTVKPDNVSPEYGFVVSQGGSNKLKSGVPTLGIYMDFMCPGCAGFEQDNGEDIKAMVDAGQINVVYHFMNFLDRTSSDGYSTRVAEAAIYIAEHDLPHLQDFVSLMMSEGVQPEEGSGETTSDEQIVKYAKKAGVKDDVAEACVGDDARAYGDWLDAVNAYTIVRPSLYNLSGDYAGESMSTPAITVNGSLVDITKYVGEGLEYNDILLGSLGIDKSGVGDGSVVPRVGGSGKPLGILADK